MGFTESLGFQFSEVLTQACLVLAMRVAQDGSTPKALSPVGLLQSNALIYPLEHLHL